MIIFGGKIKKTKAKVLTTKIIIKVQTSASAVYFEDMSSFSIIRSLLTRFPLPASGSWNQL